MLHAEVKPQSLATVACLCLHYVQRIRESAQDSSVRKHKLLTGKQLRQYGVVRIMRRADVPFRVLMVAIELCRGQPRLQRRMVAAAL